MNEGELYYEEAGNGTPLVLVHGNAGDHRHWDHQFAPLADRFRVIRYDVRGFGRSTVPMEGIPYSDFEDLRALLDFLGIGKAHIAGWSMGSGIAVDFAVAYPERMLSLVSVGPWVNGHTSLSAASMFADFAAVAAALSERGPEVGAEAWMRAPFFAATIQNPLAGAEFRKIAEDYSWWALLNKSPLKPLIPGALTRLERISVPTLILTAERDIPACLEVAELLEQRVPGAQKIVMLGTGHLLHMEQPETFNEHLLGFLEDAR